MRNLINVSNDERGKIFEILDGCGAPISAHPLTTSFRVGEQKSTLAGNRNQKKEDEYSMEFGIIDRGIYYFMSDKKRGKGTGKRSEGSAEMTNVVFSFDKFAGEKVLFKFWEMTFLKLKHTNLSEHEEQRVNQIYWPTLFVEAFLSSLKNVIMSFYENIIDNLRGSFSDSICTGDHTGIFLPVRQVSYVAYCRGNTFDRGDDLSRCDDSVLFVQSNSLDYKNDLATSPIKTSGVSFSVATKSKLKKSREQAHLELWGEVCM